MLDIHSATARINRELADVERALDDALLRKSQLMATMLTARIDNELPIGVGQVALNRLARSQRALIESGNELVRVHSEMLKTGLQVGASVDDGKCPPRSAVIDPAARTAA